MAASSAKAKPPIPSTNPGGTSASVRNGQMHSPGGTTVERGHSPGDTANTKERATWSGKTEFLLSAVGFAVGLGNIWRFPHLCYKNGGGAFLIPYLLMMVFLGLPLFYLELAFGQYASLGPLTIWRICPLFKGLGYSMYVVQFLVSIYYNVLIGYTLFYFFASFQSPVPWAGCDNWWNTPLCSKQRNSSMILSTLSNISSPNDTLDISIDHYRSPAQEYWEYRVLGLTDDTNIANIGAPRWHLTLCLLLAWIVVFLCLLKGIKSSGKVVYFSATFPYVVLFILFIRGVTLDGAGEGIKYYLKPEFSKMATVGVKVWKDAAIQILYSLGPGFGCLLTMGSFNKFHNNCQRDAVIVTLINCGTSVFAGFVIFAVLGHMAYDAGVGVDKVAEEGPGLAFVAYPEGLALMPGAPFWSLCFFFMLFNLGLDSQFAGMECIVTGLTDEFPVLFKHKLLLTSVICSTMFLSGLPCVTSGGMYVIELLDKFSTSFPLLFNVLLEIAVISWIYGFNRFSRDIQAMMGFKPNYYWLACWVGISPIIVVFILVFSCIQYDGIEYAGYVYPGWAEAVGWLLSCVAMAMIPGWMCARLWQNIGSWQVQKLKGIIRSPRLVRTLHLYRLVRPSHAWGPALRENREGLNTQTYTQMPDDRTVHHPTTPPPPATVTGAQLRGLRGSEHFGGDSYI